MHLYIINGPNLNFLGVREPHIYGTQTYDDLVKQIALWSHEHTFTYEIFQSNHEGDLIDYLQQAYFQKIDGIILNAGAYTHTSYAIRDAIASIQIPTVEVHLSDISKREAFRSISVIHDVCQASFQGEHFYSYYRAIYYLKQLHEVKA